MTGGPHSGNVRVLVVDDQELVREGVAILLDRESGISVIGTASGGVEAIAIAARLQPDVVLLDVRMPGMGGADTARRLLSADPSMAIVALTTFPHDDAVIAMLRAGAQDVIGKDATPAELAAVVRAAFLKERRRAAGSTTSASLLLTPREVEIARLVSQGHANTEIATHLGIGRATVKTHLNNLRAKIGADSRRDISAFAARNGLLDE